MKNGMKIATLMILMVSADFGLAAEPPEGPGMEEEWRAAEYDRKLKAQREAARQLAISEREANYRANPLQATKIITDGKYSYAVINGKPHRMGDISNIGFGRFAKNPAGILIRVTLAPVRTGLDPGEREARDKYDHDREIIDAIEKAEPIDMDPGKVDTFDADRAEVDT